MAIAATDAGKAVGEDAAAEVTLELLLHEARQSGAVLAALPGLVEERREVLAHDRVEDRALRLAPPPCRRQRARRGARPSTGPTSRVARRGACGQLGLSEPALSTTREQGTHLEVE